MSAITVHSLFVLLYVLSGATANNDVIGSLTEKLVFLEKTVTSLLATVDHQQKEIETLKSRDYINKDASSKRYLVNAETGVGFSSVVSPTSVHHVNTNQIIKFDSILTNLGGGYNNDTGIFVAPLNGLYLITCSVLDHLQSKNNGGNMVHAEIVKNHEVLARVFAHAESNLYRDQGANTVIVQLQTGDQIFVRTVDNDDLGLGGQGYTSFSGVLLWEL